MRAASARWRGFAFISLGVCAVVLVISALVEQLLERRDEARLTANETFLAVQGRRIRYRLMGESHPGPSLVLLDGLTASLEEWDGVQAALSSEAPVLAYDRGGKGFSDLARAYGADADADELNQLLRLPGLRGPFVLVSYSSSSMLATIFAAAHPDLVKGIVFVEPAPLGLPSLPAPNTNSYFRVFWRFNLYTVQAFFGYTRLRLALQERGAPGFTTVSAQRYNAIIKSWHHWLASAHDADSLDSAAKEADSVLTRQPFAHLPLGVLVTIDPAESPYLGEIVARDRQLAASSSRGILREAHGNHDRLLKDPAVYASTVDLVRAVVAEIQNAL
jgi:pimeloyl-ACP methyl ester carboxylesterase